MPYKDPDAHRLNVLSRRTRNKSLVDEIRSGAVCADCKKSYPPHVMDFDHVEGGKTANVMDLVYEPASVERLLAEIALCEIVCSNHHRQRTWDRRQAATIEI